MPYADPDKRKATQRIYAKRYYHSEKGQSYRSKWNEDNAERIKIRDQEYHANNRELRLIKSQVYYIKTKHKIRARNRKRHQTDHLYRVVKALRLRMRQAVKGNVKAGRSFELIGCTSEQLREHIQSKFTEGMQWNNHGYGRGHWHVDHILPCASFDLSRPEEQRKCFHFTNLQPLWSYHNLAKGAKLDFTLEKP